MPFTDEEKTRIRFHLGYLNVQDAQTFVLGVPASVQTMFLVELAMNKVIEAALPLARQLIAYCDGVYQQIVENQELLAITSIGEIAVRQDEFKALLERYEWHRMGLCNCLGVDANPFDKRMRNKLNIPVRH